MTAFESSFIFHFQCTGSSSHSCLQWPQLSLIDASEVEFEVPVQCLLHLVYGMSVNVILLSSFVVEGAPADFAKGRRILFRLLNSDCRNGQTRLYAHDWCCADLPQFSLHS